MRALLAGTGKLPEILARDLGEQGRDWLLVRPEPHDVMLAGRAPDLTFRLETLGTALDRLVGHGVTEICLAGAVRRPAIDPGAIDAATAPLVPRLLGALGQGDDGALRVLLDLFAERGIAPVGATDWRPDLLPPAGVLAGELDEPARRDAARAQAVLDALGPLDVGQGCVVSGGQVLAIEALPGTDWMLESLMQGHDGPAGGLLLKSAKPGQDRRADLPAIGPDTVAKAQTAGLSGIAVEAGGVMLLDPAATADAARRAGLLLWVRERGG